MTSKRVEKFAIRRRADAVTKERRRLERIDTALRSNYRSAAMNLESCRVVQPSGIARMLEDPRLRVSERQDCGPLTHKK